MGTTYSNTFRQKEVAEENMSTLEIFQITLREKYLKEIDVLQRSTYNDQESWANLDEITKKIQNLYSLLEQVDNLTLTGKENHFAELTNKIIEDEMSCPICFEVMGPPKKIVVCKNGHPLCMDCDEKVSACPVCRKKFTPRPKSKTETRRNLFGERLVLSMIKLQEEASKD